MPKTGFAAEVLHELNLLLSEAATAEQEEARLADLEVAGAASLRKKARRKSSKALCLLEFAHGSQRTRTEPAITAH